MKKWGNILILISILWLFLILIFSGTLYFKFQQVSNVEMQIDFDNIGFWDNLILGVDAQAPFTTVSMIFLYWGIVPAGILALIAWIFAREKKY